MNNPKLSRVWTIIAMLIMVECGGRKKIRTCYPGTHYSDYLIVGWHPGPCYGGEEGSVVTYCEAGKYRKIDMCRAKR